MLLLSLACLAGCGYKAPLFLPTADSQPKKPAAILTPETPADRPVPAQAVPASKSP